MQAIWLVLAVLAIFTVAYLGYSRYLAQFVGLDEGRETPAHKYEDGQEYVPAKKPVLLGHHFSSIAGGAPIVGPITAGVWWGWVPALLWIAIGNPILGSVHDFVSLSSSIRHEGKSIGYVIGEYVGDRGKNMLLWFAFLTIILVVAVFALVVAIVFNAYPSAATASIIYILLALLFGIYLYQLNLPFLPGTVVFVAAVFGGVWVGIQNPLVLSTAETAPSVLPTILGSGNISLWVPVIIVYAFIASVLPVWTLLQPRDYLSSFLLYTGVGGTLLAVIVGTFVAADPTKLEIGVHAWNGFMAGSYAKPLFPILFVTIACGTISGFHSLVSSGTTAKQLNRETDARLIGYGGMLGEGLLATTALITLGVAGITVEGGGVGQALPNFAEGGGIILSTVGIPTEYGGPFMALVMVSFLLTSTDTALRLGRYMFEEIVGTPETAVQEFASDKYVNSAFQGVVAFLLVSSGTWGDLWPLFGSANQMLAALALLTATVWLANWDRSKQLISTGVPMVLMLITTIAALLYLGLYQFLYQKLILGIGMEGAGTAAYISTGVQILVALILLYLGLSLAWIGYKNISKARSR
ncbi:carbon starvation CstA family protein [Halanaeroarchaeum sulfurireducens]|uniref:Carbon starvation protein A n=1 Tax=Halanaeroarchaeum sulfurireducens TaxID=1604004 RepID=A0A0F7PBB6_9EURY|nr:carbon starvation protein A [Halanaeroarchaeum sulfurireducens]AKH96628.1 carbon starvation protein A [Halanaeroarchaeum sulfurireducens]ALG81030.1 carbon starvation protein A [Halanaeroarchaeum sulfurireducens]